MVGPFLTFYLIVYSSKAEMEAPTSPSKDHMNKKTPRGLTEEDDHRWILADDDDSRPELHVLVQNVSVLAQPVRVCSAL